MTPAACSACDRELTIAEWERYFPCVGAVSHPGIKLDLHCDNCHEPQGATAMSDWTRTDSNLPPDGEVVDTIGPGGTAQPLKRSGRLWFFPDGSMYVYYTPEFWRPR